MSLEFKTPKVAGSIISGVISRNLPFSRCDSFTMNPQQNATKVLTLRQQAHGPSWFVSTVRYAAQWSNETARYAFANHYFQLLKKKSRDQKD